MLQLALADLAVFLVTVAPLKVAPVFSTLTRHMDRAQQRRTAVRGIGLAGAILLFFGLFGDDVLRLLGISLAGVRVGGGILLLLVSIQLVTEEEAPGGAAAAGVGDLAGDVAVFPLATPLIAGPATITAVIVVASEARNELGTNLVMFAVLLLVLLATLGCLLAAAAVQRRIGPSAMNVISRILGILLAGLAADMILAGIKASGILR